MQALPGPNGIGKLAPLLPRLRNEQALRERLEALVKISDDLTTTQGRVFYSGASAMAEVQALVLECRANDPHFNVFYKQGFLQTQGLPLLYLAASRSNKVLWQWLHDQLLEQVPEAERRLISAIAHLQWHATNRELDAIGTLLAEHDNIVLAQCPLLTWNSTPLYIAASLEYRDVYDLLVSQAPPEYKKVSELMWWVIRGSQDEQGHYEAANFIARHGSAALFQYGIDGKSPWQIACAHYDTRLMKALLAQLPAEHYQAALLQQAEVDQNDWHFNPAPFFKAYQAFIDGYDAWYKKEDWDAIDAAFLRIGDEFRRIPQHLQAAHFQDYPLDPVPDFKKVVFQRACVFGDAGNLFPILPAVGPGFEFSVLRSNWALARRGTGVHGVRVHGVTGAHDLLALKALLVRCQEEYLEVKQCLQESKMPEAAPMEQPRSSPGCVLC